MFHAKPSAFVGLAVHHERLCLIKLKQNKNKMILEGFAVYALPAGMLHEGKLQGPDELGGIIAPWVKACQAQNCSVAIALPAAQVMNKRVRLAAYLNDRECAAEIRSNLKHYLPEIKEPLDFDFVCLEKHEQEMELQLMVVRTAQIAAYVSALEKTGLKIAIVDVDVYAIMRAIQFISVLDPFQEVAVILDIDIVSAQLILIKQNKIISVYPIVMDEKEILLQQIKRGIKIFSVTERDFCIEKIFLTGSLRHIVTYIEMLETGLSVAVEMVSILQNIVIQPDIKMENLNHHASELLAALGLALRGWVR